MYEQIHFRLWIIHGKKTLKKLGKKGSGFFHKNSSQDAWKLFFLWSVNVLFQAQFFPDFHDKDPGKTFS